MDSTSKKKAVGFCQPPEEHRFPKGVSGNPAGRPKKKTGLFEAIERGLDQRISFVVEGRRESSTKREALVLQLINSSLKGDSRALRLLFQMVGTGHKAEALLEAKQPPPIPYADRTPEQLTARLQELLAKVNTVESAESDSAEDYPEE